MNESASFAERAKPAPPKPDDEEPTVPPPPEKPEADAPKEPSPGAEVIQLDKRRRQADWEVLWQLNVELPADQRAKFDARWREEHAAAKTG
jgi:hypothetical protein